MSHLARWDDRQIRQVRWVHSRASGRHYRQEAIRRPMEGSTTVPELGCCLRHRAPARHHHPQALDQCHRLHQEPDLVQRRIAKLPSACRQGCR